MFRLLHGLVHCHWAQLGVLLNAALTRLWTVYARFDCECACVRRMLSREICCLQHGETESNVWNTFVWSCPTWPNRWGMRISIDGPRLKSCQAVCDECMRGEIYSSLSLDAGCLAMWSWRESGVTKIWGSGHDHGFMLISFRYHGFPYSTVGDFLDPTIRVIRGSYCITVTGILWNQGHTKWCQYNCHRHPLEPGHTKWCQYNRHRHPLEPRAYKMMPI